MIRPVLWLVLLILAGCGGDRDPHEPYGEAAAAGAAARAAALPAWRSVPAEGVRISGMDTLLVEAGPHAIVFPAAAAPLEPPYTLQATLHKRAGRLYEGYGLVFGGDPLDGTSREQRYSYFLVRGDGSFLIKRRDGEQTPTVRDWTAHPAVRRDDEAGAQPNALRIEAGTQEVRFFVNGTEVSRVPAEELRTRGAAGIRVSHDVKVAVSDYRASAGHAAAGNES